MSKQYHYQQRDIPLLIKKVVSNLSFILVLYSVWYIIKAAVKLENNENASIFLWSFKKHWIYNAAPYAIKKILQAILKEGNPNSLNYCAIPWKIYLKTVIDYVNVTLYTTTHNMCPV